MNGKNLFIGGLRLGLIFLFAFAAQATTTAQPFASEIRAFRAQDSAHFPPRDAILFVGSSSFHYWTDVQSYFPGFTIINRGFGGSSLPDVIRYADQIIFPYRPKQVVIYCGENDLASSDTVSAQTVCDRFEYLFYLIRERLPQVNVVFVSLKPSPSRKKLQPKMEEANQCIRAFLSNQSNSTYIDVYHPMLGPSGEAIPTIFRPDSLHMNASGYQIWKKAIEPYLLR